MQRACLAAPGMAPYAHVSIAAGLGSDHCPDTKPLALRQPGPCLCMMLWPVEAMRLAVSVTLEVDGFCLGTSLCALAFGASAGQAAGRVCLREIGRHSACYLLCFTNKSELWSLKYGLHWKAAGRQLLCCVTQVMISE